MKKNLILAAAAILLCAAPSWSQERNRPERMAFPEPLPDSLYAEKVTAEMVEKYSITPEQEPQIYALNLEYASKLQVRFPGFENNGERRDMRSMSDSERQAFFQQMQERMAEMEKLQSERQKAQIAYDKSVKEILTKEQYKAYSKDRKKEDRERQQRMQGMGGGPGNGMGGPGGGRGGFGGPGGGRGGFGGGGFGGGGNF